MLAEDATTTRTCRPCSWRVAARADRRQSERPMRMARRSSISDGRDNAASAWKTSRQRCTPRSASIGPGQSRTRHPDASMSMFNTRTVDSIVLSMRSFKVRSRAKARDYIFFLLCFFLIATPAFSQTIARVDVVAPSTLVIVGQTIAATAAAKDADGNVISGPSFTWTSGTPNVASVDSSGQVTALFPGAVQIRARTGNITGNLTLTV